jgi:thiosulfate/3-mercaptopyruvate sulfurtransferase
VLDGGLPAWQAGGHELDTDPPSEAAASSAAQAAAQAASDASYRASYPAKLQESAVRDLADVQRASQGKLSAQVVDARSAGRFAGRDPEPRADIRSGHMPGALSHEAEAHLLFVCTLSVQQTLRWRTLTEHSA